MMGDPRTRLVSPRLLRSADAVLRCLCLVPVPLERALKPLAVGLRKLCQSVVPPVLANGEEVRLLTEGASVRMELLRRNMVPPVLARGDEVRLMPEEARVRLLGLLVRMALRVPLDTDARLRWVPDCLEEMTLRLPERRPVRATAASTVPAIAKSAISAISLMNLDVLICLTPL